MGVEVHGTVRSLGNDEKTAHLSQLAKERPDRLKLFEADLLEEGSFRKAAAGCDTVFHLASPFVPFKVKDPQAELIDPAVRGTANVLEAASATRSVSGLCSLRRGRGSWETVRTRRWMSGKRSTRMTGTGTSSITHQPYSYSKTLAEREAWRLAAEQEQWDPGGD